jgi:hypothetical protein
MKRSLRRKPSRQTLTSHGVRASWYELHRSIVVVISLPGGAVAKYRIPRRALASWLERTQ